MSTQPTDDELNALADACTPNTETGSLNYRNFAREVLALWGTPATGGEPVTWKQAIGSTNCMQCCVGYMLDLPIDRVPHFAAHGGWEAFEAFAKKNGYAAVMLPGNHEFESDYLASGTTERGTSHMVVMNGDKLVFDPHPSNAGLTSVQCVWLLAKQAAPTTPVKTPAGWLYDWFSDEGELVRDWFTTDHDEAHSEANQAHNIRALDYRGTSPQPVREPLTPERVKEIVCEAGYDSDDTPDPERAAFINGLRHGERHHGITGGQI